MLERVTGRRLFQQIYEPVISPPGEIGVVTKTSELTIMSATAPTMVGSTVVKGDTIRIVARLWYMAMVGFPIPVPAPMGIGGKTITCNGLSEVTNVDGFVGFDVIAPTTVGSYTLTCRFAGDAEWDADEASYSYTVEARTPNLMLVMPTSAMPSDVVTYSGTLTDPKVPTYGIPDKNIYLQESIDGTTFTDVAGPIRTGADGSYSGSYTLPDVAGTYYYRTRYPGGSIGSNFQEVVSPIVLVVIGEVVCEGYPTLATIYQRAKDRGFEGVAQRIASVCKRLEG